MNQQSNDVKNEFNMRLTQVSMQSNVFSLYFEFLFEGIA